MRNQELTTKNQEPGRQAEGTRFLAGGARRRGSCGCPTHQEAGEVEGDSIPGPGRVSDRIACGGGSGRGHRGRNSGVWRIQNPESRNQNAELPNRSRPSAPELAVEAKTAYGRPHCRLPTRERPSRLTQGGSAPDCRLARAIGIPDSEFADGCRLVRAASALLEGNRTNSGLRRYGETT